MPENELSVEQKCVLAFAHCGKPKAEVATLTEAQKTRLAGIVEDYPPPSPAFKKAMFVFWEERAEQLEENKATDGVNDAAEADELTETDETESLSVDEK